MFNDDHRIAKGYAGAFSLFVSTGSLTFKNGYSGWAAYGVHAQTIGTHSTSSSPAHRGLIAHESGHVFNTCDEYLGSTLGACKSCKFGWTPNGNEVLTDNGDMTCAGVPTKMCVMLAYHQGYTQNAICPYTKMDIGWLGQGCFVEVPSNEWQGEYFPYDAASFSPTLWRKDTRTDGSPFIDFNWGVGGVGSSCMAKTDYFSVRWTRTLSFTAGTYTFNMTTDDSARLKIDGVIVMDSNHQGLLTYSVTRTLTAGKHTLSFEYYEKTGNASAKLNWTRIQ